MDEKWLLCRSLRDAQSWKDRIALAGTPAVNLHGKTLRSIVLSLVSHQLAASGRVFLSHNATQLLMNDLLVSAMEDGRLNYFVDVRRTEGLAKLFSRSIRDLRLAGVSADDLRDDAFESTEKAADIRAIFDVYVQATRERSLVDYADCLNLARQLLDDGTWDAPKNLLVLEPTEFPIAHLEKLFVESLRQRTNIIATDIESHELAKEIVDLKPAFFAGYGEINEVRGVLQRVVGADENKSQRMDSVQVLYTDDSYVPLLYEFMTEHVPSCDEKPLAADPPITFSDGIATIYTRPGRAFRGWLRWIKSDALQSKLVQLVREGVLQRPESESNEQPIGYSRLASTLRRINIGFKQDRYLPAIETAIIQAEKLKQEFLDRRDSDDGDEDRPAESHDDEVPRNYGLPSLTAVLKIVRPVVELAPAQDDSAQEVLKKAKLFLLKCARYENKLDRLARTHLLDEIDGRLASLEFADESVAAVIAWLEELPIASYVLRSGPKPGCVHAAPVRGGGYSGRENVFVIGMDAARFPKATRVDPILLDAERQSLSSELETSIDMSARSAEQLSEALLRVAETDDVLVTLSYSARDLVQDRDQSPSPELVDIFRMAQGSVEADLDDLIAHLDMPVSFVSRSSDRWLSEADGRLAELLTTNDSEVCQAKLEAQFEHVRDARVASEMRSAPEFSEFDGLVPEAGSELSPTNSDDAKRVSSSRLETFGTCPRRFFFKYGLGVYPPDEWNIDPEQWLDPITLGNLVHGLFEKFMRELTSEELVPNRDRDLPRLLEMLDIEVATYLQDFPSPNEDALQSRRDWLSEACEIFLEKEQTYCEDAGAIPWVVEAAIGRDKEPDSPLDCREPVSLGLKDGRILRLAGQIDRVDRLQSSGSESYAIWDYKSGSDWAFSQEDPFKQGRKLQSFLYVGMLRHRLAGIGKDKDAAIAFGYFFPSPKTEGQRMQWTAAELKRGDEILTDICDLIQSGVFPATTNADDCTYCEYDSVCKDTRVVAINSTRKATESVNREVLGTWKKMREL